MTGTPSPTPPTKWPAWKVGGATMLTFIALLYLIEIIDTVTGHALDRNGIRPLQERGLWGILFAPLLHAKLFLSADTSQQRLTFAGPAPSC